MVFGTGGIAGILAVIIGGAVVGRKRPGWEPSVGRRWRCRKDPSGPA